MCPDMFTENHGPACSTLRLTPRIPWLGRESMLDKHLSGPRWVQSQRHETVLFCLWPIHFFPEATTRWNLRVPRCSPDLLVNKPWKMSWYHVPSNNCYLHQFTNSSPKIPEISIVFVGEHIALGREHAPSWLLWGSKDDIWKRLSSQGGVMSVPGQPTTECCCRCCSAFRSRSLFFRPRIAETNRKVFFFLSYKTNGRQN